MQELEKEEKRIEIEWVCSSKNKGKIKIDETTRSRCLKHKN
jgi:hypothetical protein